MSEIRKIEIKLDCSLVEDIAHKLGYKVRHDDFVYGYSTKNKRAKLVIDITNNISIGITDTHIFYDDHKDKAKNTMSKIMEEYVVKKLSGIGVEKISENKNKIMLRITR